MYCCTGTENHCVTNRWIVLIKIAACVSKEFFEYFCDKTAENEHHRAEVSACGLIGRFKCVISEALYHQSPNPHITFAYNFFSEPSFFLFLSKDKIHQRDFDIP